jgi:hypothetical protein
LCQAAGSALTPQFLKRGEALPCVPSIVCCVLAYVLLVLDIRLDTSSPSTDLSIEPSTQQLLHELQASQESQADGFLVRSAKFLTLDSVLGSRNLALSAAVFFTAGVSKASRPLFTTYIQRRYGFSPDEVSLPAMLYTQCHPMLTIAGISALAHANNHSCGSLRSSLALGGIYPSS